MKKQYICLSLALAIRIASGPLPALAAASEQSLLITEIQPGTAASASQEFIELYNASSTPIDLDAGHWRLEVASSTATSWASPYRTLQLTGVVAPGHRYIVASKYTSGGVSTQFLPDAAAASFSPGIRAGAGHIRLAYVTKNLASGGACADSVRVVDTVEWSEMELGVPAAPSLAERRVFITDPGGIGSAFSLQRISNSAGNEYADTEDDAVDFTQATPTVDELPTVTAPARPFSPDTCTAAPEPSPEPSEPLQPPAGGSGGDELLPPAITELLPNPAAPQTDTADEFIELYNPNDVALDVGNFVLEVGTATKHRYTLPAGTLLAPKSWAPFYSAVTGLSMTNGGGQAWLFDPAGVVIVATDAYTAAPDGQAWMYDDTTWQWTATPTPGALNVVSVPREAAGMVPAAVKKTTTAVPKKIAAVKAATTPAKTTKKAAEKAPKAPKVAKATKAPSPALTPVAAATRNPVHTGVLAAVAIFAISYGAYEYRSDIAHKIHQLRSHRATRRSHRPGVTRRRNN